MTMQRVSWQSKTRQSEKAAAAYERPWEVAIFTKLPMRFLMFGTTKGKSVMTA